MFRRSAGNAVRSRCRRAESGEAFADPGSAGPATEALPVQIGAAGALKGKDLPERTAAETIDITEPYTVRMILLLQEKTVPCTPCRPTRHFLPSRRTACGGFWAARICSRNRRSTRVFVGPRREMITPWSTNAVEITQNMGLPGIRRIEQFVEAESEDVPFDAMLQRKYRTIDQQVFTISKKPDPIVYIDDMAAYNRQEGLALKRRGNRLSGKRQPPHRAQADRQRGVRLLAGQLGALPPQDIQRSVRHRRRGDALDAVRSDQAYDQGASGLRRVGL